MALAAGLGRAHGVAGRPGASGVRRPAASVRAGVFSAKSAAQRGAEVGREWLESILSRFGPATDRPSNPTTLDFEKPLLELDKRIKEARVQRRRVAPIAGVSEPNSPHAHCGHPLTAGAQGS